MFEHKKIIINGKEYYQTIYVDKHGDKRYYLNGKLHREDGPAIEYANGTKRWYLYDIHYSKEEYDEQCLNIRK